MFEIAKSSQLCFLNTLFSAFLPNCFPSQCPNEGPASNCFIFVSMWIVSCAETYIATSLSVLHIQTVLHETKTLPLLCSVYWSHAYLNSTELTKFHMGLGLTPFIPHKPRFFLFNGVWCFSSVHLHWSSCSKLAFIEVFAVPASWLSLLSSFLQISREALKEPVQ